MKTISCTLLLGSLISINALAMEQNGQQAVPLTLATAVAQDTARNSGSIIVEKKDAAIQAVSGFSVAPRALLKQFFTREAGYAALTGVAGVVVGVGSAILAEKLCNKLLPTRVSWETRAKITTATALGSEIYTIYKGLHYLENNLIPGGVPAGSVLREKNIVSDEDGQTKTRTLRYYAPQQTEDTILDYGTDSESEGHRD